jgi:hypothetical protein
MNRLRSIWFIYTILRDIGTPADPTISIGFMRQTGPPWKTGKGLQIRIKKYIFQIGICKSNKKVKAKGEETGLLYAMQGRLLEEEPSKIGNW